MSSNRLTQSRMNERDQKKVCITANVPVKAAAPSQLRMAIATMGPVLASAFCVAAIMYPLGSSSTRIAEVPQIFSTHVLIAS